MEIHVYMYNVHVAVLKLELTMLVLKKYLTEQKMSVFFSNTNLTYDCEPGLQGFSVIFLLTSTQTVKKHLIYKLKKSPV